MSEGVETYKDGDGTQVVLIEGAFPTLAELKRLLIAGAALEVSALPRGVHDLDFLRPLVHLIADLRLYAATLSDASVLQLMTSLRSLIIDNELKFQPVVLAGASQLTQFRGTADCFPGVLRISALRSLASKLTVADIATITAPLEELAAVLPKTVSEVPVLPNPYRLRELDLAGPSVLSLSQLTAYPNLTHVGIARTRDVRDVSALRRLPKLERVTFADVGKVDSYEVLDSLGPRVDLMRGFKTEAEAMRPFPGLRVYR